MLHLAGCIAHFSPFVVVTYVRLCVEVEAENWRVTWGMMEATALGKKLFHSLVVLVFEVQYHYPDGKGTNGMTQMGYVCAHVLDLPL